MADVGLPHVTRVTLFRNGDQNFNGKHIVVNPRYYRNFEAFLDTATSSTQCTSAVTRICTPQGRHTIDSVDQLANGGTYVAVGRESFKRLKYGERPKPRRTGRIPPVWRNQLPSSGRFRKVYEGERQALKRIFVYRNGDNLTPARMILLKKRMLANMELVLAALQESGMDFDFAISKLFTVNGKQIHDCDDIVHDGKYVAIERGSRFKFMNYGGQSGLSPRNLISHVPRLPPIAPQKNDGSVFKSPKKNIKPVINKPRPPAKENTNVPSRQPRPIQKQKEIKRSVVLNQESLVSTSQEDNRESFSNVNLSLTPPRLDESPDFTLSETIKVEESKPIEDKLPDIGNIPRDIDELPEKDRASIAAQIYKASGMQREWGEMVGENRDTPVKSSDDDPVEEIVEEIAENIEDVTEIMETSGEGVEKDRDVENGSKKELEKEEEKAIEVEEEVEEDAEASMEDGPKDVALNDHRNEELSDDHPANKERPDSERSKKDDNEKSEKDEDSVNELVSDDGDENEKTNGDDNPDDDDDEKDDSPVGSPNQSRRSSQEMNSEDEVKSSEDEEDKDDDDDDDDDGDGDKSENEDSEEEKDADGDEEKDEESSVASEPEEEASNTDPTSEDESDTEEIASKENKTNKQVEKQRAQLDTSTKKDLKHNIVKGRSIKTRDVNKA